MFKKYFLATRPWSFVVSIMPVLACMAYLYSRSYTIHLWYGLWAVFGIMLFHAAANVLSDWKDYLKQVDQTDTYGATTITQGVLSAQQMLKLGITLMVIAIINGLGILLATDWSLLIIGGIGAVIAIFYPWLKYHALGDVAILFTFGILPVLGTSLVITGHIVWESLWVVLAIVPITMAVLHSNNTRDMATDHRAHILTFPLLVGVKASQMVYDAMVILPSVWVVVCVCLGKMSPIALSILPSLLLVVRNCKIMAAFSHDEHAIDHLDEMTAQLQMISGTLVTLGLFIAGLIA